MRKNLKIVLFPAIAVVLLILPGILGLMNPGFPLTDDGNWMVIRFSAFYEALKDGQFPVRFLPRLNNGFGYPVADFLYPLFMYIGVLIHAAGFNFTDTIKIIMGGSLILSSFFTFLWLNKLFKPIPALTGAICYGLFPYHLFDLYTRGSVGELIALSIVPFILWGTEKRNLIIQALGFGLLIVSHNTLALIFIPIILGYQIFQRNKFNIKFIFPLLLGISLSAFFSIPVLYDRQFTVFEDIKVSDYSRYFITWDNLNLFGPIFFITIVSGVYFLYKTRDKIALYFLAVSVVTLLITIPQSGILWNLAFLQNYIQFPFRFVSIAILSSSFLTAAFLNLFKTKKLLVLSLAALIAIYISSWNFIFPKSFQYHPDTFYSTNQATTTVKNEYMPKWVEEIPTKRYENKVEIVSGRGEISDLKDSGNKISFEYNSANQSLVQINTIYFPGWKVIADSQSSKILYNNRGGVIQFNIDKGKHLIKAEFGETNVRLLSNFVSLGSLLLIAYVFFKRKYIL